MIKPLMAGALLGGLALLHANTGARPTPSTKPPRWLSDLAQAQREAKESGKPIFVVFRCEHWLDCNKFDGQVARLEKPITDVAREFVLLRLIRMRGVDLDLFDFDYDLTWMGFFLGPDLSVYGRYGGRDANSAEARVSLAGLRHAMQAALATHRRKRPLAPPRPKAPRTVEQYPATRRLPPMACIHCHQVYEARRQALQADRKWSLDDLWVYPLPENVGLSLEVERGDRVTAIAAMSSAERTGLRKGDRLLSLDARPVASFADAQYALHRAPTRGKIAVTWQRGVRMMRGELELQEGWRKTDISWRWSLRSLDPRPWVHGEDLSEAEKKALGRGLKRLALVQGDFVSEPASRAGIRQTDVILGVNGKMLEMNGRQFAAYVRLNFKVGERVTYNLLRKGKRLDVTLQLVGR